MWPFCKKSSLQESGFFQGFTEMHCHLLPGVDDGVKTMEESLELLARYEELGIHKVWLTPHIMEDIPNETGFLRKRFDELKAHYTGKIELHLAAENMIDNLYQQRLTAKDLLPIGNKQNHLLVETSFYNPPMGLLEILEQTKSKGYYPLLAHPERYLYMEERSYRELKQRGIKFQLNLGSIAGIYGPEVKKRAEWLLKQNFYEFTGTDTHRMQMLQSIVNPPVITDYELKQINRLK